jgi:hypothetical protein
MFKTPAAQLAREIKTALASPPGSTVDGKQPLYGHSGQGSIHMQALTRCLPS